MCPQKSAQLPLAEYEQMWPLPPLRVACSWRVRGLGSTPAGGVNHRGLGLLSPTPGTLSGVQVALAMSVPSDPLKSENACPSIPGPWAARESRGFSAFKPLTRGQASPGERLGARLVVSAVASPPQWSPHCQHAGTPL